MSDPETNINKYVPKRKNKNTIDTVAPTEDDLKRLLIKENARKEKAKLYVQQNREKKLEYLREYAKKNRNPEKEKEYYEKNKEQVTLKSKLNMRKYMAFYTKYNKDHLEFQKEWDEQHKPELIKKFKEKNQEKNQEKDLETE